MPEGKTLRKWILAIVLTAIISVASTYTVTTMFMLAPATQFTIVKAGNKPSYDISYIPSEMGWQYARMTTALL